MKKKIKVFLMVLLGVLCIGGTTAVFASSKTVDLDGYSLRLPESVNNSDYIILYQTSGMYYLVPDVSKVVIQDNGGSALIYNDSKTYYSFYNGASDWTCKSGVSYSNGSTWFGSIVSMSYYCERDFYDVDDNLVFRRVVVSPIRAVKHLPAVILPQIQTILPIAIGGLALLIGSITLLPKLKKFLVG